MNHRKHSYLMIGLLVVGAGLFFSGTVNAGALFLLWPLACMGMMVAMMWGMNQMGKSDRTRDENVNHFHDDAGNYVDKDGVSHSHR